MDLFMINLSNEVMTLTRTHKSSASFSLIIYQMFLVFKKLKQQKMYVFLTASTIPLIQVYKLRSCIPRSNIKF